MKSGKLVGMVCRLSAPGSLLLGLLVGLLPRSTLAFAIPAENRTARDPGSVPQIIEMLGDVYEYVPILQDWWHADGYCQQRFARLPSELASLGEKLQSYQVQSAVWLDDREVFLQKPKQRRNISAPILVFKNKTDTKFVKVLADFPEMPAVSACAHVQWDPEAVEISTVFSYAVPAFINEFQLRGFVDEDGFVRFAIILHGHHSPYLPVFRADGQWHHFCVTWQHQNGAWAIHADGKEKASATGLSASHAVDGHGTFIIGQDQDSLGGAFKEKESFSGNLTGLHVWRRVLSREQIEKVRSCIPIQESLVFAWSSDILEVEASIQQATVQLTCPGPVEECPMFQVVQGSLAYAPCLQLLPFVCHYKKDLYLQLKKTQSKPVPQLIAQVNARANATVIPERVFQAEARGVDLSVAAGYLGVVETVLTEAEPPSLEPAALLGILQLLKEVSDMDANEPEELATLEQLGQHYVAIAGAILEEQNAEEWSEIKPILDGPMTVVENMDKMVSNLHQLLSAERPKVTIRSKNVGSPVSSKMTLPLTLCSPGVEVQRVSLDRATADGAAYMMLNQDAPDQIEVPREEVERLRVRGLRQITMTNTWYGYSSLQRLLTSGNAVLQDAAVSDGGRRYLSTQAGSSIISSSLVSDYEEISTAVRYRLWHRVQALPDQFVEPVCAFWNFSRSPKGGRGGGWSTAGCSVVTSHLEFTTCSCNHTTNFAVLLQVYEVQRSAEEESTLKTLTFVGCGVSFCALIVTFVLFLAVGVPKSERTTVHKNLIFALAAAEALLMFSELAKTNQGVCFAVTAFLHLFFMAAFAWMLVEGLLLWSKVVAVNMSEDRRMRFYYVTGWGLPVVIVGVTLATSFNKYVAENHCWLNVQTDIIWAFVGPVLFVLTVNTFVLFRVVMVTVSSARRRSRMLTPNSSLEKQIGIQIWATAKPVLVLLPVLGLTWVCGVLVHVSITWAYIFIVLNSLQGLYIFLVYAIYNSEVRNAIQRMKEKKKALSFTNCSHPINYLSSPRNTSWEVGKFSPSTPENTASPSSEKDSATKNSSSKGNFSAKIPAGLASIMSPERPAVQLTAFKSSGRLHSLPLPLKASGPIHSTRGYRFLPPNADMHLLMSFWLLYEDMIFCQYSLHPIMRGGL
ncbi:adhesion G protein-coupled receptor D2 isoform X3 [Podarcis muralis]